VSHTWASRIPVQFLQIAGKENMCSSYSTISSHSTINPYHDRYDLSIIHHRSDLDDGTDSHEIVVAPSFSLCERFFCVHPFVGPLLLLLLPSRFLLPFESALRDRRVSAVAATTTSVSQSLERDATRLRGCTYPLECLCFLPPPFLLEPRLPVALVIHLFLHLGLVQSIHNRVIPRGHMGCTGSATRQLGAHCRPARTRDLKHIAHPA
jgi:hypothetical protein